MTKTATTPKTRIASTSSTAKPRPARRAPAAAPPPAPSLASAPPALAAGTLELAILPWGEVFVDGKRRGVSPPLRSIELPPGTHTVEVRNTSFPSHVQRVQVSSGEQVRIRHRFR